MKLGSDDFSDLTVIIPTRNEADNISGILSSLRRQYKNISIIVSDDGSTDGTREIVENASKVDRRVMLLDRRKKSIKGLTISVLDAALITNTKKIIVMDADMQHPPELVGKIARNLDSCDLCIGVRTNVKKWGWYRRLLSKGISYFAFVVFKFRGKITCSDMMSGFFGIRGALFKKVIRKNEKGFVDKGYKVLLDTMRMLDRRSTRVAEMPYSTFRDRRSGKSKLRFRHMMEVVISTLK